ncbi:zinc finger protein 518A [Hemicordylus capensis]|uniref:zinc finger protein 518A n=1 Tax=Hemicordylus capensis TaxID=884348 RepID=UPI002302D54C|nr:zinc finger protein 518A [Hemicordylus capensis]XP_053160857.1 zinc finger protein 518A [Hemicordylus capensis]XP_053160858.1 zinc finger protein 518A [Hemicordylus capensis]XP_053160860.1 zinc finger protein 518A [Hemicordylus capensis]XP_053160861.1 zinc finger protein 518A [Hemicordylus capensis]
MPSEQEQEFCIKETSLLEENVLDGMRAPILETSVGKSPPQPSISDILAYGLKNLKIELPQINIPNEVILKHEIVRYMKVFQCKEKPARASFIQEEVNGSYLNSSEICTSHSKQELRYEEGLKTSAKILNFSCTKCRNNIKYSPNDLQKHFLLFHHGELPSYPCEMCNFSANDFQSFNQHRRTHRSTLVKCEICNDDHRYTLLDLTKHFTSKHCINGHFQCERCRFSTQDVGTFVQHIHRHNEIQYKCNKCHHVSFSKEEFQKHVVAHTGTFPFSCQYCNYMASRKNYLLKHIITLHRDHLYAKDNMGTDNSEKKLKTSTGLKLILKRYKTGASRKALWRRKRITSGNCRIGEEDGNVPRSMKIPPKCEEELGQSAKELHLTEDQIFQNEKHVHSEAKSSSATQCNRAEDGLGSGLGLLKKAVHGPTVLMVKNNKISVPANYSAKFMGFKVVDGKQHIVIKLLPTDKQNLPAGNKCDGVKDGSTECLQQTADNFSLPSSAGLHETNQQMSRNNSVPSLKSSPLSFSNQKIKQENNSDFSWNMSQTVAPPIVLGKCANRLPVKSDSSTLPCDLVAKAGTRGSVSWRNCIPQDHTQVLSSAGTHMLHYDPMKKPFPSEFKALNGEVNNSSKHNNVYCPTDFSNQAPLPFHNYSKIGILDKTKDLMSSKTFPLQSSPIGETTACFPQSATGSNMEKRPSLLPFYGYVNTKNTPVFPNSQPTYAVERPCYTENHHDGKRYLNTKVNQMLDHVVEKSKHENASNGVNSFMPKITSVFSLQSNQASSYLSPELNQSLQDVLKGQPATRSQKHITAYDQSFLNSQTDCKAFNYFKDPTALCNLAHFPAKFRGERNMNYSATNEGVPFQNERQVPIRSLRTEERSLASRTAGVGTLLKAQTDKIITQQLAKDKMHFNIQGPNTIRPTLPEQKKPVLLQSSPPRFFVPLRLAHQQGLQVISGKHSPKMNSSDAQATRSAATPLLLNRGPGMILTFGSGSLGTIANATENSQVVETFASKVCGKSVMELKTDSSRNIRRSSSLSACSGAVSASYVGMPRKEQFNVTHSESRISSVKVLAGYQGSKVGSPESKQQEIGQEQPVYALLPDGRQAVFLKCMSPNKSLVQNHNVCQSTSYSHNSEPKKPGAMQQKLFLKIKTAPAAANCQPVSNIVSSLQLNSMHSLNSPALEQRKTTLSSSNALLLQSRLMPASACLTSDKSKNAFTSVESVCSSEHVKTRSQKTPSDLAQTVTANKGSSFGSQMSTGTMTNKISRAKRHSKQIGAKFSDATVSQKNKKLKRRAKDDLQEPPRKKMLHRKCKQKNQMDASELESLIQAPCRPKVSKDTVRILKLLPFNSKQLVKCPRRNQPVVVLNHPDADVPEVVNVMKTIAKFKGHVLKVSLSKRTIDALLEPAYYNNSLYIITDDLSQRKCRMLKPVSPVKERFVLKLTLKKTSKNNYQIVKTTSDNTLKTKFSCWFCGRIFDNQDNWVGHGQRHLMEATRDWNSLA